MNPFKTDKFNDLNAIWYKKLDESGFIDAEEIKQNKLFLKVWHGHYFKADSHGFISGEFHRLKADYYYHAHQYLHQGTFDNETEKAIWALHSEGLGVRKCAEKLNERLNGARPFSRDRVWRTLKILRLNMRAFLRVEGDELKKEEIIDFRPKTPADDAFIYTTWQKNLYINTRWRTSPTWDAFYKYKNVISHILSKPTVEVKVCCLKEDPDVILGYAVFEKNNIDTILHWVFVRGDWQNRGIARDLVPKGITVVTHLTKIGERIWMKQKTKPVQVLLPQSYEILEAAI